MTAANCFAHVFFYVLHNKLICHNPTVAGRCIPLLLNKTMNDVVFPAQRSVLDTPVTVNDLVNGSKFLAELLNAGQVISIHSLKSFPSAFSYSRTRKLDSSDGLYLTRLDIRTYFDTQCALMFYRWSNASSTTILAPGGPF